MKKIIFQNFKQGYFRIAVLLIIMLSLSSNITFAQGQLTIIENGNGWTIPCVGETRTYSLQNAVSGVTYTWSVTPANQNTMTYLPNNQVQIQWLTANNNYTIYVNGSNGTAAYYYAMVFEALNPFITTTNEVKCQIVNKRDDITGNIIVDDENGCIDVCENSMVNYHANSMYPSTLNLSRFEWTVVGGLFYPSNTSTITNSTFMNPISDVTVAWGAAGSGSITVKEICYFGCPEKEKTVCITKIETPIAGFMFDNIPYSVLPPDKCYEICPGQTVNFQDLSTASNYSPILYWEWDFGDGSTHSADVNPVHTYNSSGNYMVVLKVTNKCGCVSTFKREICVKDGESPKIYCPSVVCENFNAVYGTHAICHPYKWKVVGGHITGQTDPELNVVWDNIGPDGFGYVSIFGGDCEGGCPSWSTVKVPVIQTIGTIDGPTTVCANSYYRFKLPAWPATNFTWQVVDLNGTGTVTNSHLENGNEIEIRTGNVEGLFKIKCSYVNTVVDCQGTASIDVYLKAQPVITAPLTSCVGSSVSCTVSNPPAGSGITIWTLIQPNGTINTFNSASGASNYTFPANLFLAIGNYTIQASNPNVYCDPDPKTVNVVNPPAAPTAIIGDNKICIGYPYTYTVDVLPNTIVNWNITGGYVSGNPGVTTATGNTVNVIWTANGSISASRSWDDLPGCTSAVFTKSISQIVVSGNIVKTPDPTPSVCEDGTAAFVVNLNNAVVGEAFEWSVDPPAMGSITTGQGTTSCTVTFNHVGTTSCQIKCKVAKCGTSTVLALTVGIQAATTITSFTPQSTTICSGNPAGVVFNVTTAGAAASSYIWDFGDGITINTTSPTSGAAHVYTNFGSSSQIYTASVKVVSACNSVVSAASFATVTVQPQPNASISPGGLTLVCPPYSFSFPTTISGNGISYQWYFDEDGAQPAKIINGAIGITYTITDAIPNVATPVSSSLGQYWAIVTNAYGCTTKTNIRSVLTDPNCNGSCTPVGPAGITNFTAALTSCGTLSATCTTLGTYPGNIVSPPVWNFISNGTPYTATGTTTSFSNSPSYTVTKPGLYQIQIQVSYQNSIPGNPPCVKSGFANVIVPIIADFKWGLACNGGGNGYNLTLTDFSAVYGNNPVTYRTWKINGVTQGTPGAGSPTLTQSMAAYLGTTITVQLIVNNGSAYNCEKTETIAIPNLPNADFTITTTNTPNIHTKSCEGREVVLNNISSPDPHLTNTTIVTNVWSFGDGTSLHSVDAARVYGIAIPSNNSENKSVQLTVTDKYNCTSTKTVTITIDKNDLSANLSPDPVTGILTYYTYNPTTPPCYAPGQTVTVTVNSGGGSPNGYQWFKETQALSAPNTNNYAANSQGAYWVQLSNNKYCYKNINPKPAVVSFKYPVQAVITGKQDVCANEDFILKGPSGTGLSYTWVRNPGNVVCGNTRTITENLWPGNCTYQLTVAQAGGCSSVSAPFHVNVHALPPQPTISLSVIDCISYTLQLDAYSGIGSNFNWSNGQNGSPIQINHGGPYRVWINNQYGCKNHADIDIPLAPSAYFWRFPKGCYTYCPGELPKWVDGPSHTSFKYWEWRITNNGNTSIVSPNNNLSGWGNNSICNPLWLDYPPLGSGSGDYTWMLDNGLCAQESEIMSVDMKKECCDVRIRDIKITCNQQTGNYDVIINIDNNTPGCNTTFYNLSILAPGSLVPIYNFSSQSPASLVQGPNQIIATIPGNAALGSTNTPVVIKIETLCNSWEHCVGYIDAIIPECKFDHAINKPNTEAETIYISDLSLAPNPASTEVNISYRFTNDNTANSRTIQVYDAVGRPVSEIKIGNANGIYKLDVSKYAQGIYFVELRENNNHVLTKRMLINH